MMLILKQVVMQNKVIYSSNARHGHETANIIQGLKTCKFGVSVNDFWV